MTTNEDLQSMLKDIHTMLGRHETLLLEVKSTVKAHQHSLQLISQDCSAHSRELAGLAVATKTSLAQLNDLKHRVSAIESAEAAPLPG